MLGGGEGGFTLLEMVVVIVLIGILAAGTLQFLTQSTRSYVDTTARDQLASVGRIAVERISRELRNALPNSVRTTPDGTCIEFIPIAASANYQDRSLNYPGGTASQTLPVLGGRPAAASFDSLDLSFAPQAGRSYFLTVYPLGPGSGNGDPYAGSDPGVLFPYVGQSSAGLPAGITRLSLDAAHRYARPSPYRRLFVTAAPVSFCVSGTALNRYTGYGVLASQPTPLDAGFAARAQRVADGVQLSDGGTTVHPFTYQPGTLQRSAVVALDLRFMRVVSGGAEWARLSQEVQIRNVP